MVLYEKTKPLLKRTPIISDTFDQIQRWDSDNLYPQRIEEIAKRSYTTLSVLKRVSDFLNGEGFSDDLIGKLIVNNDGLRGTSMNKLLTQISLTYAYYNSFSLHIGYDLNYRIASITSIPLSFCRFGLKDEDGNINDIKYSNNWERDGKKDVEYRKVKTYPVFNPDPEIVRTQIEACGGIENYCGQIVFHTPVSGQYPSCSFDAVMDHAQTQGELGAGKVSNVQNSFLATMAILYPGEFSSEAERDEFRNLIQAKSGAKNMGGRIGLQDKSGTKKVSDIFQNLSPVNLDKLYEYTERSVVDAIMENEAMPKELLGVRPESGMFNQDNMEQAYTYFNSITRNRRSEISEVLSTILSYWSTPMETDAHITPQRYVQEGQVSSIAGDNASSERSDVLRNLTGRQLQGIQRIVRKFNNGQLTYEQAKQLLKNGFGFSDIDVEEWLVTVEEEIVPPTGTPAP